MSSAPTQTRRWLVDDTERPHCARFRLSDDGTRIIGEQWDEARETWVGGRLYQSWVPTVKRVVLWSQLILQPDEVAA